MSKLKGTHEFIGNIYAKGIGGYEGDETPTASTQSLQQALNGGALRFTPEVSSGNPASITLEQGKMYNLGTVTRTVTVSLAAPISGYVAEYMMRFVAGAGCAITLPSGVKYLNHVTPTYTSGHSYEIDIVDNLVVVGEFY